MLTIGEWSFDPGCRNLQRDGAGRRLSPKAASVLLALAETPRQVWSRDALLERVWPDVFVGEEVLTHAIAELRRALGDDSRAPLHIETVHKSGYRLVCTVAHIADEADRAAADPCAAAEAAGLDLDLYCAFLEADELLDRGGGDNARTALALLAAVLDAEPDFAPARLSAARAQAFLVIYFAPDPVGLATALDHVRAGFTPGPNGAYALAVRGFVEAIGGAAAAASRSFRAALRAGAGGPDILYLLGRACLAELGVAHAAPILERAAAMRGDDYHSLMLAGKARQIQRDSTGARRDFGRALARIEVTDDPADFRASSDRVRCLVHLGRIREAEEQLARLRAFAGPNELHLACTYACLGLVDEALEALEQVVDRGWRHPAWLRRDPDFASLGGERRFSRLAQAIGAA